MPDQFREPLQYLFAKDTNAEIRTISEQVEALRAAIPTTYDRFDVATQGTQHPSRSARQIAHVSSVSSEWGTFLLLCANSFRARTILELGSCAGISSCYLASARHCRRFITVEGSAELARLAKLNLSRMPGAADTEVVTALFDEALDQVLPELSEGLDLVFIDGGHERLATVRCFERLTPYLNVGSVVLFDDISWSQEMQEAWRILRHWKGFTYAINVGRFGLCMWAGGSAHPANHDLSLLTGWLRTGRGEIGYMA